MSGITIGIGFGTARTGVPTPAEICAYAERAEDLGIDSIWLSDRITGAQLDIACVMALFGHSDSQAAQLMQSLAMIWLATVHSFRV